MSFNGKSVPAEEQWCIAEQEHWFIREGKGVAAVYDYVATPLTGWQSIMCQRRRHCLSHGEHEPLYDVVREPRYYILGHYGADDINFWSICNQHQEFRGAITRMNPYREFRKWFDNHHFIYYDDAQARLNNMVAFVKWIKEKINDPKTLKGVRDRIMNNVDFRRYLRDEWLTPERIQKMTSSIGLEQNARRRSSLSPMGQKLAAMHWLRPGEKPFYEGKRSNEGSSQPKKRRSKKSA